MKILSILRMTSEARFENNKKRSVLILSRGGRNLKSETANKDNGGKTLQFPHIASAHTNPGETRGVRE